MWKNTSQCLSIHKIEIQAPIGVFQFEKEQKNTFLVSVDIWGNFTKPMKSDVLDDTLDYQIIADIATTILSKEGDLIEKAAHDLAHEITHINFPITKIGVKIEKISPPMNVKIEKSVFKLVLEK